MVEASFRLRAPRGFRAVMLFVAMSCCILGGLLSAAPADSAEPVVLFGQVTDEAGAPIEGALAVAHAARSLQQRGLDELEGRDAEVAAESPTNAKGTYFLRVSPGAYEIVVTADGRASRRIDLRPTVESFQLEPVALPKAATFRLLVRNADGTPASGARVAAQADNGPREEDDWHALSHLLVTGEDGVASPTIGEGRKIDLRVVGEDGSFYYQDGLEGPAAEVKLVRGTEWTLRAVDPRGRALAGVVVHLTQARIPVGRTDENGEFRVRLSEQPSVTLRLSHDDGYYLRTDVADDAPNENGDETRRHVFTLDDPRIVSGQVLDAVTGEGIAGAVVWPTGLAAAATLTDRTGGFSLTPLPGFEYFLAAAPAYGEGSADLRRGERTAEGEAEETGEALIRLPPVTSVAGNVVDPGGRGLAGVDILAVLQPGPGQGFSRHRRRGHSENARTDDDGSFVIGRLLPNETYEIEASRAGFASSRRLVATSAPPEVAEVELTMEPGIQAVGRIVDENEQPVVGATVELHPPVENPTAGFRFRRTPPRFFTATSVEGGDFVVADVGRDTYRVEVRRPGFAPASVPGIEIDDDMIFESVIETETETDSRTSSVEVRLEADLGVIVLVPGVELAGRVVDSDGRPVEGAGLLVTPQPNRMFYAGPRRQDTLIKATTGADGAFHFVDLAAGESLRLDVTHPDFVKRELHGVQPPAEEPLEVILQRGAVVRGRVIDGASNPLPELNVVAQEGGSNPFSHTRGWGRSGRDGKFEITQLANGRTYVNVSEDRWSVADPPSFDLEEGQVVEGVELRVSRSAVLTGTVRDGSGRPVPEAQVTMTWTAEIVPGHAARPSSSRRTDAQGRFEFGGLEADEATVSARHADFGHAEETVQITDRGASVDLVLEAGVEVTGRVLTPDDEPAVGATVSLKEARDARLGMFGAGSISELVDGDGAFRLSGIAEGKYLLVVDHPDHAQHRTEPFEVAGAPAEHLIRLDRGATLTGELIGLEFEQLGSAQVVAFSDGGLMRSAEIRHDGTYKMEALAPATWSVNAQAGSQTRSGTVTFEAGETEETLDFDFAGGLQLEGRVRRDGESVPQAQVMVMDFGSGSMSSHTQTDFDGSFRVGGLEAGRYTVLVIFSTDGSQYSRQVDVPQAGPLDLDIRTSNVEGSVWSADGVPLEGAQVVARRMTDGDSTGVSRLLSGFGDSRSATADAGGAYRLTALDEGAWTLTATHDGFALAEATVQIVPGADLLGVDFSLRPTQGLWLDLVPAPGLAVPLLVTVAISDLSGNLHSVVSARTERGGAVRLSTLPEGSWRLTVVAPGTAYAYLQVAAPGDRPAVPLQPEARLDIQSAVLDGISEEPSGAGGILQAQVTRTDGTVHVPVDASRAMPWWPILGSHRIVHGLPAGTWTVEITLPDGRVLRGTATVQAGETVTVPVEVAP